MVHGQRIAESCSLIRYCRHLVRMYLDMSHLSWMQLEPQVHGTMQATGTRLRPAMVWLYLVIIISSLVMVQVDILVLILVLV